MTPTEQIAKMRAALNKAAQRFREAADWFSGRSVAINAAEFYHLARQCESAAALTPETPPTPTEQIAAIDSAAWDTERIPLPGEAERTITGQ